MSNAVAPTQPTLTLGQALKSTTQPQHDLAEKHPFHAILFGSEGLDRAREAHIRSLGQHLCIQETFEPLLRRAAESSPTFRALVKPHHFHLANLRDDLAALSASPAHLQPTPAAQRFTQFIKQSAAGDALPLLGVWYVFEGSTNGGTIIGKRLKDLLNLPDDRGTRFTNPHGPQVRARWGEWKQTIDSLDFTEAQRTAIIEAAAHTFTAIAEVMTEVSAAMGPAPAAR
jgi:heme oxygenase